ncbi:hypothetical protein BH20ACT16_BH20ACT16_03230 [soil metagenome]
MIRAANQIAAPPSMIDVVIPAHEKDFGVLRHAVRAALRHVTPVRRVIVVSAQPFDWPTSDVVWAPEPGAPFTQLRDVRARWERRAGNLTNRGSWVYQQLLKLGAGEYIPDLSDSYLVIDSDVIFLRPVSFDPAQHTRFPWSRAIEYHAPYRDAYERLFGDTPPIGQSLTAHHMLYDRALMSELFAELRERHERAWHEAYIDVGVDYGEYSAISEMDIYGWWLIARHPELARHRQLIWRDVRTIPTVLGRARMAADYDFVAAHAWTRMRRSERVGGAARRIAQQLRAPRPSLGSGHGGGKATIDLVIPAHEKDFEVLTHAVRGALRHVSPLRRVLVVSAQPFDWPTSDVVWVPEPDAPFPTLADVRSRWAAHRPDSVWRAGWIYQQLLKLGAGEYIADLSDSYLVIDSDVIFLRPVSYDPAEQTRFPWTRAFEYHDPYRQAYARLFGEEPPIGQSLTAHHMLYDRALMSELFAELCERHGRAWFDAFMDVGVDYDESSSISEMDIYGWWAIARHPELSRHRQLAWCDVRRIPTAVGRAQMAADFDFVAAHAWARVRRQEHYRETALRVGAELLAEARGRRQAWTSS